jgi:hypothetical protein
MWPEATIKIYKYPLHILKDDIITRSPWSRWHSCIQIIKSAKVVNPYCNGKVYVTLSHVGKCTQRQQKKYPLETLKDGILTRNPWSRKHSCVWIIRSANVANPNCHSEFFVTTSRHVGKCVQRQQSKYKNILFTY